MLRQSKAEEQRKGTGRGEARGDDERNRRMKEVWVLLEVLGVSSH